MNIETRIGVLEESHKNLDADVHSLARVIADIKNIVLTNQHDIAGLKIDVAGVKKDISSVKSDVTYVKSDVTYVKSDVTGLKSCVAALAEATCAGFQRADEQLNDFKQETRERFNVYDKQFDSIDKRFDSVDQRFDSVDKRFDQLELLVRQLYHFRFLTTIIQPIHGSIGWLPDQPQKQACSNHNNMHLQCHHNF